MTLLIAASSRRRGFTFVEILLVVVLLGVVAAMALPDLSRSFGQVQLKTVAADVAYLLRYAQSRAVIRQHRFRMAFAADASEYWLEEEIRDPDRPAGEAGSFQRIAGRFGRAFRVPDTISVKSDQPGIILTSDGGISPDTIRVCHKQRCLMVLTRLQKGQIHVLEEGTVGTP